MDEPLEYLNRKSLMLNIMSNLNREIMNLHPRNALKHKWKNLPNWAKVKLIINDNTSKAGSTSSTIQCLFLGVDPNTYDWKEKK